MGAEVWSLRTGVDVLDGIHVPDRASVSLKEAGNLWVELRALRWTDIDLAAAILHVRQRVDRYGRFGPPKSEAGTPSIPLPPIVVNTLREWKLQCPRSRLDLLFPNREGRPSAHADLITYGLIPTLHRAGIVKQVFDTAGEPVLNRRGTPTFKGRYTGIHSLRHWYASWCVNRIADGGLELPAKTVQVRLGHSTISMTLDTYGHLFPHGDGSTALAAGELALLG